MVDFNGMKKLVDVELPLFIIIDEINNGKMSINDLTEEQIKQLPKKVKEKAERNA